MVLFAAITALCISFLSLLISVMGTVVCGARLKDSLDLIEDQDRRINHYLDGQRENRDRGKTLQG